MSNKARRRASLIERLEEEPFALNFSGQGFEWLGTLRQAAPTGGAIRSDLEQLLASAQVLLHPVMDELSIHRLWGFDPLEWADRATPPAFDLAASSVSVPGIFLAQVAQLWQLHHWGLNTSKACSITGHSQGIFAVRMLEQCSTPAEILAIAELIGAAIARAARQHGLLACAAGMPMRVFSGVSATEVEAVMTQVAPEAVVGLINAPKAVVGVGRPEDLNRVEASCPEAKISALPMPMAAHHPALIMAVEQVVAWAQHCDICPKMARELSHYVLVRQVNWVEETSKIAHSSAAYVLELGPGPGMAAATAKNLAGSGITIISVATERGRKELLDAPVVQPAPPSPVQGARSPDQASDAQLTEATEENELNDLDQLREVVLGDGGVLKVVARGVLSRLRQLERPGLPAETPAGPARILHQEFGTDWARRLVPVFNAEKVLKLEQLSARHVHLPAACSRERRVVLVIGALSTSLSKNLLCHYLSQGVDVVATVDSAHKQLPPATLAAAAQLWRAYACDGARLWLAGINEESLRDIDALAQFLRPLNPAELVVFAGVDKQRPRAAVTGTERLIEQLLPSRQQRLRVRLAPEESYSPEITLGHRLIRGRWPWDVVWERIPGELSRPPAVAVDKMPETIGERPLLADPSSAIVLIDAAQGQLGTDLSQENVGEVSSLEAALGRLSWGDAKALWVSEHGNQLLLARGETAQARGWPVQAVVAGGPDSDTAAHRCGVQLSDIHVYAPSPNNGGGALELPLEQPLWLTPEESSVLARIDGLVQSLEHGSVPDPLGSEPLPRRFSAGMTTQDGWFFVVAHSEVFLRTARC
ncbi:hypothetical protein [Corynebacterium alimapuense]|uniref:Malonyl-CoA:ACP transacylase (MAT) domain-containing protein n=1 Tax=Corynebacterium alimapuense TaxID=1576874 RepID=A0A3M8KBU5_9CORY|nr:hypothetical protein [Corynebacterium alimapuense]RNE50034.1 hypothetical protein C5L39_01300 [Corynebacterium alimapuense]